MDQGRAAGGFGVVGARGEAAAGMWSEAARAVVAGMGSWGAAAAVAAAARR